MQRKATMENIQELGEELIITSERHEQLTLDRKRLAVDHGLTLHRDKASIKDLKAMIQLLEDQGAPENATIRVDGRFANGTDKGHIRVHVSWKTEAHK